MNYNTLSYTIFVSVKTMDRAMRAAQQWHQERPDMDTAPMVILGRLAEADLLIARLHLNPLFATYGLQPGEFDVMVTLRRSGEPYELTPTALYDTAMISSGSMTNRINRLVQAGLVQRKQNPADGRGFLVCLTQKGLALIEALIPEHVANQQRILSCLSQAEQAQLGRLLEKLITGQTQ